MSKNVRLKLTENEKLAQSIVGANGTPFNMKEQSIDKIIEKEKAGKFNEELEKYVEEYTHMLQGAIDKVAAKKDQIEKYKASAEAKIKALKTEMEAFETLLNEMK